VGFQHSAGAERESLFEIGYTGAKRTHLPEGELPLNQLDSKYYSAGNTLHKGGGIEKLHRIDSHDGGTGRAIIQHQRTGANFVVNCFEGLFPQIIQLSVVFRCNVLSKSADMQIAGIRGKGQACRSRHEQ
jgi:hypothetical protein